MIRIGTVRYLNALPLVHGLEARPATPAELAALDRAGELDAALMPVVELFDRPELTYVPGIAIASAGPADSVRLHLRRPVGEVRTLALDPASRTSNALVRLLFERRWGRRPQMVDEPDAADAYLTIGDPAFAPRPEAWLDLGAEWSRWTGKPFVYALWTHRRGHPQAAEIAALLARAKAAGLAAREAIARREGPARGLDAAQALVYLTRSIRYDLGPEEVEGLELFERWYRQLEPAPASSSSRRSPASA